MCDYSLESVKSRAAVDGEDLTLKAFRTGSKGFVDAVDPDCAVCCKSGVEMVCHISGDVMTTTLDTKMPEMESFSGETQVVFHTSDFKGFVTFYKDGFITPSGRFLLLQHLPEGTKATVTKALPAVLADAAKGDVAFEPEIKVTPIETPAHALVD